MHDAPTLRTRARDAAMVPLPSDCACAADAATPDAPAAAELRRHERRRRAAAAAKSRRDCAYGCRASPE